MPFTFSQPEFHVTDQNQALPAQGSDAHPQGEHANNNNTQTMESLLKEQDLNVDLPQAGEIRTGIIASINPTQILVSIGAKSEGVVSGRELEQLAAEDREALQVGQEIHVYVLNPEDTNGNVVLSLKRAQEQISWDNVEKMLSNDEIVESKIMGFNKGGLIVGVEGLRGFVPSSQISALRRSQSTGDTPEQRWQKMIGQPIAVRVIEVDRERRRLILSERAASTESRQSIKERVIDELEEGQVYTGRVTSLANFGAFININGADGLVHLSELSWEHIDHPREVLEVGQEVKVKVINVDKEKKRIGLSVRALQEDPWRARVEKYSVGQLVEGVITRLTKFGAFARLEGDIEGLIHISEIAEHRIEHPKEVLKEGEVKSLRVIRIDPDQHRIGLSLRKVDSAAFADKDFKILTAEYTAEEDIEPPEFPESSEPSDPPEFSESSEAPQPPEFSEPPEEPPAESTSETPEA
jgi:small subunit ribosomal protein S1